MNCGGFVRQGPLYVALALLVPVAWRLLRLLVLGRMEPNLPARQALSASP